MDEASFIKYIRDTFDGVDVVVASQESGAPEAAWGDTFFFYDPGHKLADENRFPFATIVTKDYGDFDCASNLNRTGVFRLNIGVSKETCRSLFGEVANCDFTALDKIMPHPVYGKMHWVCVLNPGAEIFQAVRPLLAEAYDRSARKHSKTAPTDNRE